MPADLCVFTGDYRADETGPFRQRSILAPMAKIVEEVAARDGSLAVLGNHDCHEMVEPLEEVVGVRVLTNEQVEIARDGQTITLIGFDDPYRFYSASSRRFAAGLSSQFGSSEPGSAEASRFGSCWSTRRTSPSRPPGSAAPSIFAAIPTAARSACPAAGRSCSICTRRPRSGAAFGGAGRWSATPAVGAGVAGSLPVRLFAPPEITLFRLRRVRRSPAPTASQDRRGERADLADAAAGPGRGTRCAAGSS